MTGWLQAAERKWRCAPCAALTAPGTAVLACFWVLGLLNNSPYVICLALAPEMASGGVGLVYFAAIAPTILVKSTVSLWYHAVDPSLRMLMVAALMSAAYAAIAFGGSLAAQLAGVALVSLQGGLGEASALALCARCPPVDASLTAWSSGTGFAGVFGYLWVATFRVYLHMSFRATLLLANATSAAWVLAYFWGLQQHVQDTDAPSPSSPSAVGHWQGGAAAVRGARKRLPAHGAAHGYLPSIDDRDSSRSGGSSNGGGGSSGPAAPPAPGPDPETAAAVAGDEEAETAPMLVGNRVPVGARTGGGTADVGDGGGDGSLGEPGGGLDPRTMTGRQKLALTLRLWPYTVPLFFVYFAEYTMQSGAWSAIGFPVGSAPARRSFYLYANWSYQAAVFISRSTGTLLPVRRRGLWAMPALQCALLAFFVWDAARHWWYGWSLISLCFVAGLLGGSTYVNAFTLLSKEVPLAQREFSLASACVADSLGIAAADAVGVLVQGCLLRANGLAGEAVFKCGARR